MRRVGLVLLAVSILLGGAALWGLKSLGSSHAAAATAPVAQATPRATVVVAARSIAFGETIDASAVKTAVWPADATPPGAFRSVSEFSGAGNRRALVAIEPNEPILPQRLSGPGGRATLSAAIRPGLRAASIRVDDVMGVSGFVLPGDLVDVLVTRQEGEKTALMRTDVLLSGVRVLAVDQTASSNKTNAIVAKTATVEVTPDQAAKLALGGRVGTLSLALRGADDPVGEAASAHTVRTADLRVGGAAATAPRRVFTVAARHAGSRGPSMDVYRAGSPTRVSVQAE